MHATHTTMRRTSSSMLHCTGKVIVKTFITENPMVEVNAVKNFLKDIKHFVSKDTVLFVKI